VEEHPRLWIPQFEHLRIEATDAVIKALGRNGPIVLRRDTPPLKNNPIIILRDSMLYRGQAVGFHVDLLQWQFRQITHEANTKRALVRKDRSFLYNCRRFLTYLMDDVLFNAISMLDYSGNLVGVILGKPSDRNLKWNGFVRAARDRKNPLSLTRVGQVMVAADTEWVGKLNDIRSRIIHEHVILGDGVHNMTMREDRIVSTLFFDMPPPVVSHLRFLKASAADGKVDIVAGGEQIAVRALDVAASVMTALLEDLGGRLKAKK